VHAREGTFTLVICQGRALRELCGVDLHGGQPRSGERM